MDVLSKFLLSPITPNRGELEACLIFANCSSQQREMREGVVFFRFFFLGCLLALKYFQLVFLLRQMFRSQVLCHFWRAKTVRG